MQRFDYAIIGGGILGLSVGRALLQKKPNLRIAIVEKEDNWGQHQTGRNSGVIHSGVYYKPRSLKAKSCREGNRRLVEFCETYGVRYETCGKVIVATTTSELPLMESLYERGIENGLAVKKLTAYEIGRVVAEQVSIT